MQVIYVLRLHTIHSKYLRRGTEFLERTSNADLAEFPRDHFNFDEMELIKPKAAAYANLLLRIFNES